MSLRHRVPKASRLRSRRSVLGVAAVAAATALLAGCSGSAGGSQVSADAAQTITFYSWDSANLMKPMVAAFEKANPKITVNVSYGTPVEGYISALQTRLSSGTAADVFIITAENKVDLMKNKLVEPLNDQPYVANLAAAAKSTYTQDGKLYGAASSSWAGGIVYNKDLLAKAGITTAPANWAEFIADCQALKAKGITPFMEAGDQIPEGITALLGLQNAQYDGTMDSQIWAKKLTFAKAWTPAVELWSQLFTKGLEPRTVAGLTTDQVMTEFAQGKVAMTTTGSWGLSGILAKAPKLDFGYWPVPGASATYWAGAVSPGYAVNAASTHKAAAEKFVAFLVSKEGTTLYNKLTGAIMTTSDSNPVIDPRLEPMLADVRAGRFYLPQVSWPSNSAALNSQATSLLQQVMSGQIQPAQVGAQMDQKLSSLAG